MVAGEPAPQPAELAAQARRLLAALPSVPRGAAFTEQRAGFVGAPARPGLRRTQVRGWDVGFVEEVRDYST